MNRMKKSKKILSLILIAALMITGINIKTVKTYAKDTNKKAITAYRKLLSKEKHKWREDYSSAPDVNKTKNYKFACIDLNGDGIKELVVENPEACWADGSVKIFRYVKGKVKKVLLCHGFEWYKKSKIILVNDAHTGAYWGTYYKIKNNGKIVKKAEYSGTDDKSYKKQAKHKESFYGMTVYYTSYKINGKKTSYKKYKAALKKMLKAKKYTKIQLYKNTEDNRDLYL